MKVYPEQRRITRSRTNAEMEGGLVERGDRGGQSISGKRQPVQGGSELEQALRIAHLTLAMIIKSPIFILKSK